MTKTWRATIFVLLACICSAGQVSTGSITAAGTGCDTTNACITLVMPNTAGSVAVVVTGTFTATLQFEQSVDNATWVAATGSPQPSGATATSATAAGTWTFTVSGMLGFRVRASAYTSGAAVVTIQASPAARAAGGGGTSSPLTTKGDIWVFSSADTRLPIGANGLCLTADSAQTTGLLWQACSGSTPALDAIGDPSGNKSFTMAAFTLNFNTSVNSGAGNPFSISDFATNTGTGYLFTVSSGATSAIKPFRICYQGTTDCIKMDTATLQASGAAHLNADRVNGSTVGAATVDTVLSGNGTNFLSKALTGCSAAGGAVSYNTATHAFGCNSAIDAATLGGATFAAPTAIGSGTPSTGAFTTLTASTSLGIGTAPASCGSATGINCMKEASTAGTPTAAEDYIRADSVSHRIKASVNNGAETNLILASDTLAAMAATTSAQLAGVVSDETGSGALVFGTSPTIVTPTIASFASANHDHSNSAGGGQVSMTAFAAGNRTGASTSKAVTATAAGTSGNCAQWAASGELGDAGAACGSGSGSAAGASLLVSTTDAGPNNTATETSLIGTVSTGSKTIAANTLGNNAVTFYLSGYSSTPLAPDSLTVKFYLDSTAVCTATYTPIASLTNAIWRLTGRLFARGTGAGGTVAIDTIFEETGTTLTPSETSCGTLGTPVAIDFTASHVLDVKAKWNAAQAGELIKASGIDAYIGGAPVTSVMGQTGAVPNLSGAVSTTNSSVTTLATKYTTSMCEMGIGDGLNAIPAGTYVMNGCYNDYGATYTITAIRAFSDNSGTTTVNAANDGATGLLTGAVTATTAFASGTQSGTTTIAANHWVKATIVADGTSKMVTFQMTVTR